MLQSSCIMWSKNTNFRVSCHINWSLFGRVNMVMVSLHWLLHKSIVRHIPSSTVTVQAEIREGHVVTEHEGQ